jgi:CDGSH-type Zn-finger protein/uncharacterized Fe-S cluster protein YjdI
MTEEPQIIVQSREQLISLLTEAAEIEHGLMCCYLYAAFSLKTSDDSGLNAEQLAATRAWRTVILQVAVDEMLHLALVANLMEAVGATPHFGRSNFPVSAGFHPAGVVMQLAPFCRETMDHFVYLERPEGSDLTDGAGFEAQAQYSRGTRAEILVPSAQDYLTVGHLYRAIEEGFTALADRLGEANLFIGDPSAQVGSEIATFAGMVKVVDLASAVAAIEEIVTQGEGAPGHSEDSHYAKFCAIRDRHATMCAADPGFAPAWPCARNPVMRKPPIAEGRVHVAVAETARVLDIGNAAYGLMLRCLMGAFGQKQATDVQRRLLYGTAMELMHAVVPVAEQLARMPATVGQAEPTAGLTFTLPRSIAPVRETHALLRIVAERAVELARGAAALAHVSVRVARSAAEFERIARRLGDAAGEVKMVMPAPVAAPAAPAQPVAAAPVEAPVIEEAVGRDITIRFEGKRCIHARFCVLQAPTVFLANTPGQWIYPDTMDAERLVAVAENCPSGAIQYERRDGRPGEVPPPVNVAKLRENGPYGVHAEIVLAGHGAMTRAVLCRCGASKNKPFCDSSHIAAGFVASGEPATRPSEALAVRNGLLTVTPTVDGPLAVEGALEICAGTGRTVDRVVSARLCRCGGSENKPFCDGTHARIGFRAP